MRKEWTTIDKTAWGPGPWENEPDKVQFVDEATGLDGLMVRHDHSGHWCGYVGVPPGHPFHGKDYDDCKLACGHEDADAEDHYCDEQYLNVHGGLTFANSCSKHADEATGICHVPEPGRPHDVWWLGFDCAHAWDIMPAHDMPTLREHGTYRDAAYVEAEVRKLASQLATVEVA